MDDLYFAHWTGTPAAGEVGRWTAVADRIASELAADVLERDARNQDPHREMQLLRDSGLVTLLGPAELGGGGAQWSTAFRVVRAISRVDASIAQVLAYHYINESHIAFLLENADARDWYRRSIAGRWVWGDSVNPVDPDLELIPVDGSEGWVLRGTKRFSTGSSVGDMVLVHAVVRDETARDTSLMVVVDHDREGIEFLGDWDALGQRLSASGSVRYHDVRITAEDILGPGGTDTFSTLAVPALQLAFVELYLGSAEGALQRGRALTVARPNAWFLSPASRYSEDPFVQRVYGELVARVAALEALADRAGDVFDRAIAGGAALTAEERDELEIHVAKVKIIATETALDVASRIFETTGSSSAKTAVGLDLFWRNVRTHTLHDPVDYKKLEVGANFLTGAVQRPSAYT